MLVNAVEGDRKQSLHKMREAMLSWPDLEAAVFIGGMEGVEIEYEMLTHYHSKASVISVAATGGAALQLAMRLLLLALMIDSCQLPALLGFCQSLLWCLFTHEYRLDRFPQ